jgi:GMP synthase (glutamine-hydrolysing)
VFSEILSNEEILEHYREFKGLIFSGGPASVYNEAAPTISQEIFELGIPILGICYGHQLIMKLLGGEVESAQFREYGDAEIYITDKTCPLVQDLKEVQKVWMSHGDEVSKLADGFLRFASSVSCKYAGVYHPEKKIYGIQFHPEVTHTPQGNKFLENFIEICGVTRNWDMKHFLDEKLKELRESIPEPKKVFMLVSGGVDSTVAYTLLSKALGKKRVVGLLVDTGFMRKKEVKIVKKNLELLGFNLNVVDASEKFYSTLKGIKDPESKRKIIGNLFLEVQSEEANKIISDHENWLLGQGTIYPDTIESGGTKLSHSIKTHHNRIDAILDLIEEGKVVEPIKELYKDEVRSLGKVLGLRESLLMRHPFPGPGLAVRMIATREDHSFFGEEKLKEVLRNYSSKISYKVLPIRSVGVQGDSRSYKHCALLNNFTRKWEKYNEVSTLITNQIKEINRVVFLPFEKKLPKKLVFSEIELNKEFSDLLRDADFKVNKILKKYEIMNEIWQMPIALLPIGKKKGRYSIVLRPVESNEAMTANFYPMKRKILKEIVKSILELKKISFVFYDITNKPPGTIEWE